MISELHDWHGTPRRILGDGRQAYIAELTYGRGRICVGELDNLCHDIGYTSATDTTPTRERSLPY